MGIYNNILNADGALIVGAGLAGLFCALKLAPRPVTILSPKPLGFGASSAWAQAGVAAALGKDDSPASHARDTELAGAGIVDMDIASNVTKEAAKRIEDLAKWGTPFDKDENGNYILSREAAHSKSRVVGVLGDRAGREIMAALIEKVRNTPSIRIVEGITAVDLARSEGRIIGIYGRKLGDRYGEPIFIRARATILAAGGLGGLYAITTNPPGVRGHAMGMAARAGAIISDAEFVQYHPTAILTGADPAPLATEALRGDGAILLNELGERFMLDIHKDAELAPRDIVARANFAQIKAGHKVFLDTRKVLGEKILSEYPTVANYCKQAGIDPVKDMIPITPAAHFHMGGVKVDENGRSSLAGLWVCGEASATGLHGANRLASNSLLEAIVYGARIAKDVGGLEPIPEHLAPYEGIEWNEIEGNNVEKRLRNLKAVQKLRLIMSKYVGVERDEKGLKKALKKIQYLEENAKGVTRSFLNMTSSATLVAASALLRKESRGAHFRTDFLEQNAKYADNSEITLSEAKKIRADCS